MNNIYKIYWGDSTADSRVYGTSLEKLNNSIIYSSPLMSPGLVIHAWHSKTMFHSKRSSPELPLLKNNFEYSLEVFADIDKDGSIQSEILFFDYEENQIDKYTYHSFTNNRFTVPEDAVSYQISLINEKHTTITFDYLKIVSISTYDFWNEIEIEDTRFSCYQLINDPKDTNFTIVFSKNLETTNYFELSKTCDYLFIPIDDTLDERAINKIVMYIKRVATPKIKIELSRNFYLLSEEERKIPKRIIDTLLKPQYELEGPVLEF